MKYEIDPPTARGSPISGRHIKRGDVSQSSFAFRVHQERWIQGQCHFVKILEAELFDVSPVTYPAYARQPSRPVAMALRSRVPVVRGRSPVAAAGDVLRRLRQLAAAPSACERCRVGRRRGSWVNGKGGAIFYVVCPSCSERKILDRRARILRGGDRSMMAARLRGLDAAEQQLINAKRRTSHAQKHCYEPERAVRT